MAHQAVMGTLNWIMMFIYTFYDTIKYPNALIHVNQLIKSNRKHFSSAINCTSSILWVTRWWGPLCLALFTFSCLSWSQYSCLIRTKHVGSWLSLAKTQWLGAEGHTFTLSYPGSFGTVLPPKTATNKKEILTVNLGNNFFQRFFNSDILLQGQRDVVNFLALSC